MPGWRAFRGLAALAIAVPLLVGAGGNAGKGGTSAPAFGHEVVVDHQRVAGEPSISISPTTNGFGYHDLFVSAPFGFSTTASFIWKSKDGGQTFYVVWSQASVDSNGQIDGPSTIYMATSTNNGATWTAPINVSAQVAGLQTNLFPWVAAGSNGKVDIVWYGTPTLGSCPNQPCGPAAINGVWNVYMAQTLNAVSGTGTPNAAPTFTTTKVSEYSNHYGAICTMGIGCTTGGDRGLVDFISVQADPSGAADVVWADSANTDFNSESSALIAFRTSDERTGLVRRQCQPPFTGLRIGVRLPGFVLRRERVGDGSPGQQQRRHS